LITVGTMDASSCGAKGKAHGRKGYTGRGEKKVEKPRAEENNEPSLGGDFLGGLGGENRNLAA